jgi:hypothetical protein
MMVALAIIAVIFLLSPGVTFAGVQGGAGPTVTSPVSVGQTGLDWFLDITNTSSSPNNVNQIKVTNIFVTTACGDQVGGGICPAGELEADNTIQITPVTARAGQLACAGVNFTVLKTGTNEYQFIPDSDVLLAPTFPAGNPNITCRIPFKVNINAGVANDAVPPDPPKNTAQLGRAAFEDITLHDLGTGAGSSNAVVNLCTPTIETIRDPASSTLPPTPAVLNDKAKLTKDPNCPNVVPTGTITFNLYGVNDQTCTSAAICTKSVTPISGCISPSSCEPSTGCSVTQPGVYHWIATYSGDISNQTAKSNCADEPVPVLGIVTAPNPTSGCAGTPLNDSATLSGGNNPGGTITFKLFGPGNDTCSGTPICTIPKSVTGNGTYSTTPPGGCTATAGTGTYHWVATYSGDANNPSVSSNCADEPVVIQKIPVQIVTAPNPTSGCVGAELNDKATLSGGCSPTGTITFKLFGVGDQTCSSAPIFSQIVPVNHGAGAYNTSPGFVTAATGTYHWVATYSGDTNNDSVSSICAAEAVVINECKKTGESPYIGIVGNDCVNNTGSDPVVIQSCVANPFYFSPKHRQFLFDQEALDVPVCFGSNPPVVSQTRVPKPPAGTGCEQFRSNKPINQAEICDTGGTVKNIFKGDFEFAGEPNAVITKGSAGYFEWWIRLPKKPNGEINICIQCGVLKPNTFLPLDFEAIKQCAAETGERIGRGFCTRNQVDEDVNPIVNSALPKITVWAYPGPFANENWAPFRLTAYKNPGTYNLTTSEDATEGATTDPEADGAVKEGPMRNSVALQVLDGSTNARVLLKSCMDKCIIAKIPVSDQVNARGDTEQDLEAGDLIKVRLDVPYNNTVDIYCHSQSTKIMGIGVPD